MTIDDIEITEDEYGTYIYFLPKKKAGDHVRSSIPISNNIIADLDENDKIIGFEIL